MECGALDGGKESILRRVRKIPAEGDTAEFGIYQYGAVAVVPGEAEQPGLSGSKMLKPGGELRDASSSAAADCLENVARGREAGFDAGLRGMHRTWNDAANARDEARIVAHGDNAGGSADDIDHVAGPHASADRVPMRVEGSDGDRDARAQAELFRPARIQDSGE